jgi:predicted ArsR family transcriptional regulator
MFQRVTPSDFFAAFHYAGRENQFSHEAKEALFNHLEQLEEVTGEQIELDVIALCCEYQESSVDDIISDYGLDASGCKTDEERREMVEKFLNEHTTVIWHGGDTFLFQLF